MNRQSRSQASLATMLAAAAVFTLLAGCGAEPKPEAPPEPGVGDLEIASFRSVANQDETFDIELDFFDNLTKPTTIDIAVQVNQGEAQLVTLDCKDVPGQRNTCSGGTGTCSGDCPDRTYDQFPGKVFSGTCKKPRIGLKVCTCTDYRVKSNLGLSLTLAPTDSVTITLDPHNQYEEASEENNSLTIEGASGSSEEEKQG